MAGNTRPTLDILIVFLNWEYLNLFNVKYIYIYICN